MPSHEADPAMWAMLNQINQRLSHMEGAMAQSNLDAQRQRDVMFGELKEIKASLAPISTLQVTVDRIEPLVDAHERAHQRSKGVAALIGAIAGGAISFVGSYLKTGGPGGAH